MASSQIQWFCKKDKIFHLYTSDGELISSKFDGEPYHNVNEVKLQPKAVKNANGTYKKVNYISNKELLKEIALSKQQNKVTDRLGHMMMLLVYRISQKHNFKGYSYNAEMRSTALVNVMEAWHKFDETRYDNPFAYLTTCVTNSMIFYLNKESAQQKVRDKMLTANGMLPSFKAQQAHADEYHRDEHTGG